MSKNNKDLAERASYSILEPHRRSTSSRHRFMGKISFTMVERAIESLGHGLSIARSTIVKDILPMNLSRLEVGLRRGSKMLYEALSVKSFVFFCSTMGPLQVNPKFLSEY